MNRSKVTCRKLKNSFGKHFILHTARCYLPSVHSKSRECFKQWIEWQNACDWLLVWIHSIQKNWPEAEQCIKSLKDKCSWSPCCFTYIHAAVKQMVIEELRLQPGHDENQALVNQVRLEQLQHEVDELLELAPRLKNSLAGKTIYFEKFVTKR